MDALGINLGYFLMQLFGFTLLVVILSHFLYGPILKVLEERKARIAKGLEDARQAAIARDNADIEAKKILDAARTEAAKIRSEAATQAEETARGIEAKANSDAKAIVAAAKEDGEAERNRVLSELRGQVAAIAIAAANKLVGEALDEQRQRQLLAEFFAKVPGDVTQLKGDKAEVVSALPLSDEEKGQVSQALSVASVEYKVDPRILGGLVIRVGDQVVDNSVAGQMDAMRDALR
jgi:F-type H+-transporting ATPase subunit b